MVKIPFNMLPWTIGMKGKTRERARAEYYLTGYDLDIALLDIDYENATENELKEKQIKFINIQKKYNKINDEEYDYAMLIKYEDIEQQKHKLELDKKYNKISEIEYEKQKATLNKEPWVKAISEFRPGDGLSGLAVELDWNDIFIEQLKENGYVGINDDHLVQQWFAQICRTVAEDEGIMDEIYPVNKFDETVPQFGPKIYQERNESKTDYS